MKALLAIDMWEHHQPRGGISMKRRELTTLRLRRQMLRREPCHHVGVTACTERHNNGHRSRNVDAVGLAGQLLDMWAPGGVPKLEPDAFRPIDYVALYPRPDDPLLSLKVP